MVDAKVLDELKSQDWKSIFPKLTFYAIWQTRIKNIPKESAKDFVQEATKQVWTFERIWDPTRCDILKFLKGVVRSLADNLVNSAEYKKMQRLTREGECAPNPIKNGLSVDSSPEEDLERKDIEKHLLEWAGDDEDMKLVLNCIFQGAGRRQEIADELAFPIVKVYNIMKRVRREVIEFLKYNN